MPPSVWTKSRWLLTKSTVQTKLHWSFSAPLIVCHLLVSVMPRSGEAVEQSNTTECMDQKPPATEQI